MVLCKYVSKLSIWYTGHVVYSFFLYMFYIKVLTHLHSVRNSLWYKGKLCVSTLTRTYTTYTALHSKGKKHVDLV